MEREELLWLLESYETEVNWLPDRVNPYGEMENILDGRDILEDNRASLSGAEVARLEEADQILKEHAQAVYDLLGRGPKEYRERNNVPRSRWWWYIDELVST